MNVLLLHDGAHQIDSLFEVLSSDDFRVEASTSTAMVAALTQERSYAAMFVSVDAIDDARVLLAMKWREAGQFPGALVLLCPPRLAEDAYRLCRRGAFDDYVTVNPLYDAFQLRLAVWRSRASRGFDRAQAELTTMTKAVSTAQRSATEGTKALDSEWSELARLLRSFLQQLTAQRATDASARLQTPRPMQDQERIMESVDRLRKSQARMVSSVSEQLATIEKSVARLPRADDKKLLLVDDDAGFFDTMEVVLQSLGYRVQWTGEPRNAVAKIKELDPWAVLLDVDMPGMNGIEVLRAIREDDAIAETPVILLTGQRDLDTVMAAKALAVKGYLVKPPTRADLAEKLGAIGRASI